MNIINNSNSHFLAFCYVPGTSWEMSPTQCGPHTKCNGGGGGGVYHFYPYGQEGPGGPWTFGEDATCLRPQCWQGTELRPKLASLRRWY